MTLSGSLVPVCLALTLSKRKKSDEYKSSSVSLSPPPSPSSPLSLSLFAHFPLSRLSRPTASAWSNFEESRQRAVQIIVLYYMLNTRVVSYRHRRRHFHAICTGVAFPVRRQGELEDSTERGSRKERLLSLPRAYLRDVYPREREIFFIAIDAQTLAISKVFE